MRGSRDDRGNEISRRDDPHLGRATFVMTWALTVAGGSLSAASALASAWLTSGTYAAAALLYGSFGGGIVGFLAGPLVAGGVTVYVRTWHRRSGSPKQLETALRVVGGVLAVLPSGPLLLVLPRTRVVDDQELALGLAVAMGAVGIVATTAIGVAAGTILAHFLLLRPGTLPRSPAGSPAGIEPRPPGVSA